MAGLAAKKYASFPTCCSNESGAIVRCSIISGLRRWKGQLRGFEIVTGEPDCQRTLNRLDANDQGLVLLGQDRSFDPVQCAPADPDPLTHFHERIAADFSSACE